jgi:hypothetical protein
MPPLRPALRYGMPGRPVLRLPLVDLSRDRGLRGSGSRCDLRRGDIRERRIKLDKKLSPFDGSSKIKKSRAAATLGSVSFPLSRKGNEAGKRPKAAFPDSF